MVLFFVIMLLDIGAPRSPSEVGGGLAAVVGLALVAEIWVVLMAPLALSVLLAGRPAGGDDQTLSPVTCCLEVTALILLVAMLAWLSDGGHDDHLTTTCW